LEIIEKIFEELRDISYETSVDLAKEKGHFDEFVAKKYLEAGFIKTLPKKIKAKIKKYGIRNALINTEAPTGKIALLAGASSGIEPVFSFTYTQKDRLGERTMYHPLYQKWVDENGEGDMPDYFVVADDLSPEEHVKIQALIQKYTDSSISKTVNAPKTHTVADVKKLYELAYETGCKGISYMREGSREGTLIRGKEGKKQTEPERKENFEQKLIPWARPIKVSGATYKFNTPVGKAYVTVNHDEYGAPVEVFINVGNSGSDILAMAEALGRVISKSLTFGSNLSTRERAVIITSQLKGIGGSRSVGFGESRIASLPDAVAKALALDMGLVGQGYKMDVSNGHLNGQNGASEDGQIALTQKVGGMDKQLSLLARKADVCPSCGNASLVNEMGCKTCHGCGYSEC
jgi:ribonucleoside-diphosphate reductase alpha chain